jgi:nuclear pore complex protein Nup155
VWDGLDQIIVSVGLVKPKAGVFVPTVRYLLVLTTPVEVIVLAVSFAGDDVDGEMILQPTTLSVPTDEVNMLQVVGTPLGRAFMCGNDGNLYELDYSSPGGWFSKKCRKRNHTQSLLGSYLPFLSRLYTTDPIQELRFDPTRNILYALTSSSCIHGYWLGTDGLGLVQFATRSNLQNDPSVQARVYGPAAAELKIVSIFPVTMPESSRIHLVAIASSGVRLYLTTTPSYSDKPYSLQVVHVDHPLRDMRNRTCKVQQCYFSSGCLVMAADVQPDTDQTLFALHFDMVTKEQGSGADEPCAAVKLSGTTWAINEAPLPRFVDVPPELTPLPNVANELATQHFVPTRRFLCLTNNGLYTIERRRPLDQLIAILGRSQGNIDSSEELKTFFSFVGEAEACAMCLVVACCFADTHGSFHRGVTAQIRDWATAAFLYLGANTPERAVAYFGAQTQFSDRYNGFGLFLTRLLQPVWQIPINRITVYSPQELRWLRDNLANLLSFVEQTRFATNPLQQQQQQHDSGSRLVVRVFDNLRGRTPNHVEQTNLSNLVMLLSRSCEALNMLILLNEHDVTIMDRISPDRAISNIPFSEFVSTQAGVNVTNVLIAFLIKVGPMENTDEICRSLSVNCPLFFNQSDREHMAGVKLLREAALQPTATQAREDLLAESLAVFRKIAADLSFADVFTVIDEMRAQGFHEGVVEVALLAAQSREKQRPADLDDRYRCFDVIVKSMDQLYKGNESARALYKKLKRLVLRSGNEECLRYLFSWYLQQGLQAELLDVESPFLETFLRASDLTFLAEYYTANHRFGEAAATYVMLAESQAGNLELNDRIVFLGHALANVKQADGDGGLAAADVRQLAEKADVAQIQRRIWNELRSRYRPAENDQSMTALRNEVDRLNTKLFSISELYNQFAWPHQLWETCLVIMYTANHECPRNLVDKIWQSMIVQERRLMRNQGFAAVSAALSRKVEHVARLSSLSLKVFPVDSVCEMLEQVAFEMGSSSEWVPQLMLSCGVSFNSLYDLYHHLLVSEDDRAKKLHYSAPLRYIVEKWNQEALSNESQFRIKRLPFAVEDVILRLEECGGTEAAQEVAKWQKLAAQVKK